ncbi:MAG: thymidylate synthase [Candidatus Saccharibacteria bacterium]
MIESDNVESFTFNADRQPDLQYHELLRRIRTTGKAALSGMDSGSEEILGHMMRFDLADGGFPLITERDLTRGTSPEIIASYEPNLELRPVVGPVKQALGEVIAFINGARTQEELESYGCNWWKPWTSDPAKAEKRGLELGDLGPGSYGAAFHDFPDGDKTFDQYDAMIKQIKDRPELRTHIITPFIPNLISRAPDRQQKALIVPCHGLQHYNIDTVNKEISLVHWQRSADVPIGLPFNMVHYAALLMMVGQVTGYKPKELIFQLSNAHIYDQHKEKVDELLEREPFAFPILKLNESVKNLKDFRVEDFSIQDYNAHPPMNMGGTPV